MVLGYSYVPDVVTGIPPRKVNGGLYTGEPAKMNAPWANVPIVPETHLYMEKLGSDAPSRVDGAPNEAYYVMPTTLRPGNNNATFPSHQNINGFWCTA
jgi:hypothetical protein